MNQEAMNRIRRKFEDLESMHKSDIAGSLFDYLRIDENVVENIVWTKNLPDPIKNKITDIIHEILD